MIRSEKDGSQRTPASGQGFFLFLAKLVHIMKLRNRLKHYRHKHEMNAKAFAAYLGVSYYLYVRWERQEVQPSALWTLRICTRLDIPITDLLEEVTPE